MKNVIISIGLIIMMLISVLILFTVYGQNTRQNEIDEALSVAVEQTLENYKIDNNYVIKDEKQFKADLVQNLIIAIESDSELTVNILSLDMEKGLLDVEAIEKFSQPNGSTGTVSSRKTVILEEYRQKEPSYYFIEFLYAKSESEYKSGEFTTYKKFSICEGSKIIYPSIDPTQKAKNADDTRTFMGWSLTKPSSENNYSPEIVSFEDAGGNYLTVSGEMVFYAVFE